MRPQAGGPTCDWLDGMSDDTISAMATAFERQWSDLRACLHAMQPGDASNGAADELREIAHRLAGSSAQLGLVELEAALRELEALLDTGASGTEKKDTDALADLIARLDAPLDNAASWRRLSRQEPAP
jgi:two-component system aerobic respiration control sensor histidine kinase ArcB